MIEPAPTAPTRTPWWGFVLIGFALGLATGGVVALDAPWRYTALVGLLLGLFALARSARRT